MNHIMKIVKSLEESGLLIKGVSQAIKNEAKEQKGGFLGVLLSTLLLGASFLGNQLTGKGAIATSQRCERSESLAARSNMPGKGAIRANEGTLRTDQDFKCRFIL